METPFRSVDNAEQYRYEFCIGDPLPHIISRSGLIYLTACCRSLSSAKRSRTSAWRLSCAKAFSLGLRGSGAVLLLCACSPATYLYRDSAGAGLSFEKNRIRVGRAAWLGSRSRRPWGQPAEYQRHRGGVPSPWSWPSRLSAFLDGGARRSSSGRSRADGKRKTGVT